MDTEARLKILKSKIHDFAKDYKEKESRIHALEKENLILKAELNKQKEDLLILEEKLKVTKLVNQVKGEFPESEANRALKSKLNEYIKEIDKCVALLNN